MEQNSVVTTSSLEIQNLRLAHEQYDGFVDVSCPLLSVSEFKSRRGLPLNEQCAAVFYSKTAHLGDKDFIEVDRQMLEIIGFKNNFIEKKDKQGNVKDDEHGNPLLSDMRNDFSSAIRCLRNTVGFVEGKSFDDLQCHFIVQKPTTNQRNGGAGLNKKSVWIRKQTLEHFVIMTNTSNSFMIREYFIDLKRIMTEYNMYQAVYRSKQALSIKDTKIDKLVEKMDMLTEKIDSQSKKIDSQSQKLDMLARILYRETDSKVIEVNENKKKLELMVLQKKRNQSQREVLRGQTSYMEKQMKRKHNDMTVVGKIDSYKNTINLLNRLGETTKSI